MTLLKRERKSVRIFQELILNYLMKINLTTKVVSYLMKMVIMRVMKMTTAKRATISKRKTFDSVLYRLFKM